ncbi:MAG TPA: alanine racemase [Candidatus Limnocylindria bacterium]|nr:alanine racemase [Candidatus Limnocylindria bacterium]
MSLPSTQTHKNSALPLSMSSQPSSWIELSKSAFAHNIAWYKKIIGDAVALAVVVKGNAYGHGMQEIARLCQEDINVDWLCTTSLTEALTLRAQGVTKPLLVLCIIDDDVDKAIEHSIDLVVYDMAMVTLLSGRAQIVGKPARIHLKIDTGLTRFGFFPEQALEIIHSIKKQPFLDLQGLCSHFSESDNQQQEFTQQQLATFHALVADLETHNIRIPFIHTGNSAATISQAASRFTLVRIGAGAYGLQPSAFTLAKAQEEYPGFALRPVMTWKTRIMSLRTVPADKHVGYAKTFSTTATTLLGVIPVGYFEGYDRRLSNKGIVVLLDRQGNVKGYAPVVGRVCMNVSMINLTALPDVAVGDEVVLLGAYEQVRAYELATVIAGFNPREITTRINAALIRSITE